MSSYVPSVIYGLFFVTTYNVEIFFLYLAGLYLFAKHAAQFKEYIAKDHEVSKKTNQTFKSREMHTVRPKVFVLSSEKHSSLLGYFFKVVD